MTMAKISLHCIYKPITLASSFYYNAPGASCRYEKNSKNILKYTTSLNNTTSL